MRLTGPNDDDGTLEEAPGPSSCYARSKRVNLVRHDVGANGFCLHHSDIQLLRQADNGKWATVRKKCPDCIKEDCPVMLGEDGSIPNKAMVEHQEPRYTSLRSLLQRPLSESTLSSAISTSDLIEDADNNGLEILLRRPDRISVSICSPSERRDEQIVIDYRSTMVEGLHFCYAGSGEIAIQAIQGTDGSPILQYVNACALMEGSNQVSTFFDVGDVLEFACGVDLNSTSTDVHDELNFTTSDVVIDETTVDNSEIDNDEPVCNNDATEFLLKHFRQLSSDKFDKTLCISTNTTFRENPIRLCQAIVLFPKKDDLLDAVEESNIDDDTAVGKSDIDSVCFDIGIVFSQRDERLIIGSVRNISNGWLNSPGCAIKEGDVVVGINEYITSTMSPTEARQIIHAIVTSRTTYQLSITTITGKLNTASTRWSVVRKSVVGAVGGTLAASGAVLMVTPLHPIGHVVALGGVAVLATEFDAPRKAMVNAKHRFGEGMMKFNEMRRSFRQSGKEGSCEEGSVPNNCED